MTTIDRASDNPFPSILMVEGDPEDLAANPASGQRRLAVGADHLLYLVDDAGVKTAVGAAADLDAVIAASSGQDIADALAGAAAPDAGNVFATMADVGGGGGGGGILAITRYNPGTDATYAVTGTSLADLDATNAKVTFTVPASGAVLILFDCLSGGTMNGGDPSWIMGLRESSSQVGELEMIANGTTAIARRGCSFYVSGLTPGDSKTYKLASKLATSGGTGTFYIGSTERGGLNMTVLAA